MSRTKRIVLGWVWLAGSAALAAWLAWPLLDDAADQSVFLPAELSYGHHQIGLACTACHTSPLGGAQVLQDACMNCHAEQLKQARDSHPPSKFNDPRNAARLARLDARRCVSCHREHRPEITGAMGVTVPPDVCFHCHQDIAEERPSHRGMAFSTCSAAGCHNYHDNRALYEDFLVQHLHEPALHAEPRVPALADYLAVLAEHRLAPLTAPHMDPPAQLKVLPEVAHDWESTAHARAGINCSDCHNTPDPATGQALWRARPDHNACGSCHAAELQGFTAGLHGMRLDHGLSHMTPALARLPMRPAAADRELSCTSCHSAHRFDRQRAAVDACLSCHDDAHSRAYKASPHFALWHRESTGQLPPGSGVSCATCHLPREVHREEGQERLRVQHNQSLMLRPNEKMIRGVCLHCHGLGFALDALADAELVQRNFPGPPARHVPSLEMADERARLSRPTTTEKQP